MFATADSRPRTTQVMVNDNGAWYDATVIESKGDFIKISFLSDDSFDGFYEAVKVDPSATAYYRLALPPLRPPPALELRKLLKIVAFVRREPTYQVPRGSWVMEHLRSAVAFERFRYDPRIHL